MLRRAGVAAALIGFGGASALVVSLSGAPPQRSTRPFPDTTSRIAILADQLPANMTAAQQRFAAQHYVGSQKLTRDVSAPLRAINPGFLVLHYHLAIWQSAPGTDYIIDGVRWGNDFPAVDAHEDWFWHNPAGQRVASTEDRKLLMNIGNPDFVRYWTSSIVQQAHACDCDAVFADSASPALLTWEAQSPPDPRLSGAGARDTAIPELGGRTYIQAWQAFMTQLDASLAAEGLALIPNTGALITTWDTTDYGLTAGAFVEDFASPGLDEADWLASTNTLLSLSARNKILVLQTYLKSPDDVAKRRYALANYLLVKGSRTYLDYFSADAPLEWYPEWDIALGAARESGKDAASLLRDGVYQRRFANGLVLVNPSLAPVTLRLGGAMRLTELVGGGPVPANGRPSGRVSSTPVRSVTVAPHDAAILLR